MRETRKILRKKEERKTEKGVPDFGVILAHRQTDKNHFSNLEIDKYFHLYLLFFLGFDFDIRLLNKLLRKSSAVVGFSFSFFFFFLEEDFSDSCVTTGVLIGVDVSNETFDFCFFLLGDAIESSISVFLRFLPDFDVSSSL